MDCSTPDSAFGCSVVKRDRWPGWSSSSHESFRTCVSTAAHSKEGITGAVERPERVCAGLILTSQLLLPTVGPQDPQVSGRGSLPWASAVGWAEAAAILTVYGCVAGGV